MNIFCVSNDRTFISENTAQGATVSLVSEEVFFQGLKEKPDAIIIKTGSKKGDEEVLKKARKTPQLCLVPVFPAAPISEYFNFLHDGIFTTYAEILKKTEIICERVDHLNYQDMLESQDYRLLAYLYSRDADLVPFKNPLSPQIYRFPAAELLGDDEDDAFNWIEKITERGLLAPEKLIDRIRLCRKCEWSHLNFVDICPACQSLNIFKVPFIHCFTCGHVAPQEKFLSEEIMQCPKCRIKLRHIGSDYDRPMEEYYCPDCDQSFLEPQIIAHCTNCGHKNNTENLIPKFIHSYKLTAKGKSSAKVGGIEDIFALLDNLNYMHPKYFIMLLNWMMLLCKRYPGESFSLIGINVKNAIDLTASLGRHEALKLIESFAGRLRQLIRTTDITTRTSEHNLWILLPKTAAEGCAVLAERILNLKELTKQQDGVMLEYSTIDFTAPDNLLKAETAELLVARLATALED